MNLIPQTNIRTTEDAKLAVIDILIEVGGYTNKTASNALKRIASTSEAVSSKLMKHKFAGERQRFTPVADRETVINILQMLPGIAGDKFRAKSAKLVLRYLDADITLADEIIQRTENPEKLRWIAARAKGKEVRIKLTGTLARHGVNKEGFRDCTNAVYKPLFGGTASLVRKKLCVKEGANPRDAMDTFQLGAVMLAEEGADMIITKQQRHGNWQCEQACLEAGGIIANAIKQIKSIANSPLPSAV
jgi:hypothetical protein